MSLSLYGFQEVSVAKLSNVVAGLCGDDMGLGKTIQAIEIDKRKRSKLLPFHYERGKPLTLVVTPVSVIGSWVKHFADWQPSLEVYAIDPKRRDAFVKAFKAGTHDIFICHWEALRLIPELHDVHWFHVIADEAHRAKNRKAQQTVALKKIKTTHKLALSGTPADNRPDDLWSILNWLYPRTFTSYWKFRDYHLIIKRHDASQVCRACFKQHKNAFDEFCGCANVEELMNKIEPFYVRRLKEQVIGDLPDKYYTTIEVDLTMQQRRAYEEMRRAMLAWVGSHEDEPIAAPIVVAQLTRLQQFACAYGKLIKVRVQQTIMGEKVAQYVDKLQLAEPSSKLDAASNIITDNPNRQIVVFAQSKQIVNMLARRLQAQAIPVGVVTGDVAQAERDKIVTRFQKGELQVFVGTIAAGGEGITLTAASTVIFIDRVWSPAKNRQAEDRLHRIGQENAVQVIDIIARDTIDLGRLQKIELKWSWIKQILGDIPTVRLEVGGG